MGRDSVHRRGHGKLAHAEKDVAAGRILVEAGPRLEDRFGRGGQVRGPAKELRHLLGNRVHDCAAGVACGECLAGCKAGNRSFPACLERALLGSLKLRGQLGVGRAIAFEERLPCSLQSRAAINRLAPVRQSVRGNVKTLVLGEAEKLLGRGHAFRAQRLAMRLARARSGAAVADHRSHRDERRPARLCLGCFNRRLQSRQVVAVGHALHVPVISLEAFQRVLGIAQACRPIQRNLVVIVKKNQLAQPQRSGQRGSLVRDALHQVAVAQHCKGVVVHHIKAGTVVDRGEVLLGNGHADGHRDALPQRAGGHFHSIRVAALGVAGGPRAPLAEAFQIVQRHIVAGEKQRPIQQRRGVSIRQHKTVPVGPLGVRRIVLHQLVKQQIGHRRATQRSAGMAAIGLFHLVHGQQPQGVDGELIECL